MTSRRCAGSRKAPLRRGVAAADYFLGIGIVLPLVLIALPSGRRMMQLVFELMCTLVAWPFM
jgi:hypothetical protein